jgi:hypothetical protein
MEGRFGGEAPLDELSVVVGISLYNEATIKDSWKRIFAPIRAMLVVERLRQLDDCEQRANAGIPGNLGNFIEVYSPSLRWLRGRD